MNKPINDGGPAFPSHGSMGEVVSEGMSLRDYFAGQVLAFTSDLAPGGDWPIEAAREAYRVADAMIAERQA